ncbi:MAG TPA: PBP1A family penicillin-binding protein [Gemmatimonadaceae bacterium]|nr:PBP1A family penicillin-binding protein [Gemmatimonadaceae bacterium]
MSGRLHVSASAGVGCPRARGTAWRTTAGARLRFSARTLVAAAALSTPALGALPAQSGGGSGEVWQIVQPPQSSLVYSSDGSLIGEIGKEWRTSVALRALPKYVGQAFVAVEDQRFYEHDGVDVIGMAAAIKDALGGHARGASTITQQLVGNMHPDEIDRSDRSISRKLREQAAAREMEKHYTKAQILEAYLNQIDFGHGWSGVDAASRHYFGKPATQLTLAEAATLAALPKGPAIWDPIRHPDRAKDRRNLVLSLMADQGYITKKQAAQASRQPVKTAPDAGMPAAAPYLVDVVRRQAEAAGIPVGNGGYRIITTVNSAMQIAAKDALVAGLKRVEDRPDYRHPTFANHPKGSTDYLQGMVVAMDPATGNVLALVGGRNYAQSPFNRAVDARRQPGSAFKPFVYAEALRDSLPANEIIPDTALAILMDNGAIYRPQDDDGRFLGPLTMREALVKSRNSVAVQLGLRTGIDSVALLAHRLGISTPVAPFPSSAIGASVVSPLDLVSAYTVFDNLGAVVAPRFIERIEDRAGRTVWTAPASAPRFALDPRIAFIVRDMLRDVVTRGTATSVRRYVPERIPVAGKTGTTNDNTDAWFVGMTPEVVAGVWVGFDKPQPIAAHGAAGGALAAPIWGQMIAEYYQGRDAGSWDDPPAGLVTAQLDRDSGRIATPTTPPDKRYTEYFLDGTQPQDPWSIWIWGPIGGK